MAPAGYSGTPLPKKLGIKQGHRIATLAAPVEFSDLLQPMPANCEVFKSPRSACDVIIAFCLTPSELNKRLARAIQLMHAQSGTWLAWPKKSSGIQTVLDFNRVQSAGLAEGLVDNKIAAISDVWSGLRMVVRKTDRTNWPQPR